MKEDLVRNESDGYMRMAWHTDLQKTLGGRTNRGGLVARADPVIVVQGSPPGKILILICLEINGSVACRVRWIYGFSCRSWVLFGLGWVGYEVRTCV